MSFDPNVPYGTKLNLYHDLLIKWQESINLVANSTVDQVWSRHFDDSAQLIPFINKASSSIIDLGSGAGFPGLVISLMTGIHVKLIESDRKKCIFLREIIRRTSANASVINERIERYNGEKVPIITSRALASLEKLLDMAQPHLLREGHMLLLKGQNLENEIADAKKKWQFNYEIHNGDNSPSSKIIKVWNIND